MRALALSTAGDYAGIFGLPCERHTVCCRVGNREGSPRLVTIICR